MTKIEIRPGILDAAYVVGIDIIHDGKRVIAYNSLTEEFSIVGGHSEDGETAVAAALRELKEETGISVPASELKPIDWHLRHPKGIEAQPFKLNTSTKPEVQNADEINAFTYLNDKDLNHFMGKYAFEPFSKAYYSHVIANKVA